MKDLKMKLSTLNTCVLIMAACSAENQNEQNVPVQVQPTKPVAATDTLTYISRLDSVDVKQLAKLVKPEHELNTLMGRNDTVVIVLGNHALFFPLGNFTNIAAMRRQYPHYKHQLSGDRLATVDDMQIGANKIRFIKTNDEADVFIVNGKIADSSLQLSNGVIVGMSKEAFLHKYFIDVPKLLVNGGKVIVLESALSQIKHYYNFSNKKLASIEFTSDYVLD